VPGLPHSSRPIRIAIIDDHPIARCGMQRVFDSGPGLEVVCSVASLAEFRAEPDVVIFDLYLDHGRLSAAEIEALTRNCPALVVSASAREQDVLAAIRAGASGYLIKTSAVEDFAEAVRTVAAGGFYVSSQLADFIDTSAVGPSGQPISLAPREREALSLIAQGFTQSQAATRMGISPATIDTYIKRIRRKLGPGNKAELTRRAIELGEVSEAGRPGHTAASSLSAGR
jgi:two-component system, NarL family, nitrate/nitrite response regulator NarL